VAILKWVTFVVVAVLMALILSPIQVWLSLVQLPSSVAVVSTRGGMFNGSGVVELAIGQKLQTAKLSWQWCPGLGLTNWCVAIKQAGLDVSGSVAYWDSRVVIRETTLSVAKAYQIPSLAPVVFDIQGDAMIEKLVVDMLGCEYGYINKAELALNLNQTWVFGSPVGATQIDVNTSGAIKKMIVKGDSVSATITLQANEYRVDAKLMPPPSLYNAMSLLLNARLGQAGVWTFTQQGVIPC
jgi:hypothetical protein